jgi:WD40 repeat protein
MKLDHRIEAADSIANPHKNDIFISYSDADKEFAEKLDRAIRGQGRDPWIDWEDIPVNIETEAERQQYIELGILEADTFVFIVSPNSIDSKKCGDELDFALAHQRCLVFILHQEIDKDADITSKFENNNWLSSNEADPDNFNQIAKAIVNIQIHSRLLVRSNQWHSSKRSESFLLRGRDLVAVKKWIEQPQNSFQLTPIQKQYIDTSYAAESKRPKQTDVFISYSRKDRDFAEKLYTFLQDDHLNSWIDWENIPVAVDWWQEIEEGIETSHTFVFIVSPSSVVSPYCQAEIAHAIRHGKRLIPVQWRSVPKELWRETFSKDEPVYLRKKYPIGRKQRNIARNSNKLVTLRDISDNLKRYQWYYVQPENNLDTLRTLLRAIRNVPEHIKAHTRLLLRAIEWEASGYKEDFLLRKSDLKAAKQWLAKSKLLKFDPSWFQGQESDLSSHLVPLQEQYIQASDKAESTQKRSKILSLLLFGFVISGLSGFALIMAKGEITALVSSLEDTQELDSLIKGIRAGKRLQRWSWLIKFIDPNLQVRGVTALQQEVYGLRELNRLQGHNEKIFDISFSPNAELTANPNEELIDLIASASGDNTIKLWTLEGRQTASLEGHQDDVRAVAFNPDGKTLASASNDGVIKLWSASGRELWTSGASEKHRDQISSISYSPGGDRFASASRDGTVKLWTDQGRLIATLPHAQARTTITSVTFSPPYGERVASAGFDGTIKIWTRDGKPIATSRHGSQVISISYSPNGQFIASAGFDGTLKLWDQNGKLVRTFDGHQDNEDKVIHRVVFSSDGQTIATAGGDGLVKLWNREDGKLRHTLQGHQGAVYRAQFSFDGRTIATAGVDGIVRLWSSSDGTLLNSFEGHRDQILSIDFADDKPVLISAGEDRDIRLWRLDNPVKVLPHENRVNDVSFSHNGRIVASSGIRNIKLWRENATLLASPTEEDNENRLGDVASISFSFDDRLLASVGSDNRLILWKVDGSKITRFRTLSGHRGKVHSVGFSPTSNLLVSGDGNGTVKLWRVDDDSIVQVESLEAHQGAVYSVSFSHNGQILASVGEDRTIQLWRVNDGKLVPLNTLTGHRDTIHSVSFSSRGRILASASADETIRLWTLQGELIRTLGTENNGHTDEVLKVNFNPDGKLLASASRDGTVKLWTEKGSLITTLREHGREVSSVSFSPASSDPDTITLASAGFDNKVLLWKLPRRFDERALRELLQSGCESARDYLRTIENPSSDVEEVQKFCLNASSVEEDKVIESVN